MSDWVDEALCRSAPDIFFPEREETARQAKSICRICPVAVECLAEAFRLEALLDHAIEGVWGGTSPTDRAAMRRNGWQPM